MKLRSGLMLSLLAGLGMVLGACGVPNSKSFNDMNEKQGKKLCEQLKNKSSSCDGSQTTDQSCDEFGKQVAKADSEACGEATAGDAKECAKSCGDLKKEACIKYVECLATINGGGSSGGSTSGSGSSGSTSSGSGSSGSTSSGSGSSGSTTTTTTTTGGSTSGSGS